MQPVSISISATNMGLAPIPSTSSSNGSTKNRGRVPKITSRTSLRPSGGLPRSRPPRGEARAATPRKNSTIISTISRQYTTHTAISVAKWSRMLYSASGSSIPKKYCKRDRCPELEMGRNSATPCTAPKINAIQKVMRSPHLFSPSIDSTWSVYYISTPLGKIPVPIAKILLLAPVPYRQRRDLLYFLHD